MKYSLFSVSRESRIVVLVVGLFGVGIIPLLARPDPPAADRLMDPTKPGNHGGHLFFHADDDTAPSASEQAFKDFKKGPATFAEFCKLYPLTGKPLGQDRLTLEVLATEVDVTADPAAAASLTEPTALMVSKGRLIRQSVFANSQAQTENVLPLDRESDGSKMPEPAWEGERLFTCIEQTDASYTLALTFAESRLDGWTANAKTSQLQPVMDLQELNSQTPISADGQWKALTGSVGEASTGGAARKLQTVLFVRLVKN